MVVVLALAVWATCSSGAEAQSGTAREEAITEKGPSTLLEALQGSRAPKPRPSAEEDRLEPDRPHFPEAVTAAGKGRVILESGYTFNSNGSAFTSHAFPEMLWRVGMFSDWFEFRFGQSFLHQREQLH